MSEVDDPRPRCFGQVLDDGSIELAEDEAHHLLHVLRVRPGARVEIVDGGRLVLAEVQEVGRRDLVLAFVEELPVERFGAVPVRLAAAVLHPPAMERLVRLATEFHVARISPVLTERTQHRREAARLVERWRRIAREACKQARRVEVPQVDEPVCLDALLREPAAPGVLRLCLTFEGASLQASDLPALPRPAEVWLLQGPEGGWSPAELRSLSGSGVAGWSLGRAVFRAETCPLVALVLLQEHYGELLRGPEPPAQAGSGGTTP